LPENKGDEKGDLIRKNRELIESVSGYITPEGLAHDVLDRPDTFLEVNLPQMLSYAIYRGIASGWLDKKWRVLADRCRQAAKDKVDAHGFVQDVCGAPHFVSPGIAPEGQAFHLLMEAARKRCGKNICTDECPH
jgi:rhamnogalacturonyl hydrolase YesR